MKITVYIWCLLLFLLSSFFSSGLFSEEQPGDTLEEKYEKKSDVVKINKQKKDFGIGAELGYTHYRRGFGLFAHVSLPLRIVKNLYFEPSLRFIAHRNSNSSFFSVINYNYDNKLEGIALAVNTNFKYRFQIIPSFGILLDWGAGYGLEFNNTYNYYEEVDNFYLDFFISPEFGLGTFIKIKNFRIDINLRKFMPVVLFFYQTRDGSFYTIGNYKDSGIYIPLYPVCLSAFSITTGVTYFLK